MSPLCLSSARAQLRCESLFETEFNKTYFDPNKLLSEIFKTAKNQKKLFRLEAHEGLFVEARIEDQAVVATSYLKSPKETKSFLEKLFQTKSFEIDQFSEVAQSDNYVVQTMFGGLEVILDWQNQRDMHSGVIDSEPVTKLTIKTKIFGNYWELSELEKNKVENLNKKLAQALVESGIYLAAESAIPMNSNSNRHLWASRAVKQNARLTYEEVEALADLSGAGIQAIQNYLRLGQNPEQKFKIPIIDRAIKKSRADQNILLYRFVDSTELEKIWNLFQTNPSTKPLIVGGDKGYSYFSLDMAVAEWWKDFNNKSTGVIIRLNAPAGTPLAYIDSRVIHNRGLLEVVLPRGLKLKITGISLTQKNIKVLEAEIAN